MKRKHQDDSKAILERATKKAVQRWGDHYPLSKALLSTFGIPIMGIFAIGVPMQMINLFFDNLGLAWLSYVYGVIVFVPMFVFAYRSRLRIQPYLMQVLAELGNPVCRKCKYDLRGLADFDCCPECGVPVLWVEPTDETQ